MRKMPTPRMSTFTTSRNSHGIGPRTWTVNSTHSATKNAPNRKMGTAARTLSNSQCRGKASSSSGVPSRFTSSGRSGAGSGGIRLTSPRQGQQLLHQGDEDVGVVDVRERHGGPRQPVAFLGDGHLV